MTNFVKMSNTHNFLPLTLCILCANVVWVEYRFKLYYKIWVKIEMSFLGKNNAQKQIKSSYYFYQF